MISRKDLKQIIMLGYLTDEMIDKLIPITDQLLFGTDEVIFRQGDKANRFYMLKQGKVLLELKIDANITVIISSIKAGYAFGWSSMLDDENYTVDALCSEPCEILSFRADKVKQLFEQDHSLGYIMSQRLLRIIKKRYDIRTEQFLKTITHHPDLVRLIGS